MNASRLVIVGAFKGDIEAHLHSRFSKYRRHGEWFDVAPIKRWFTHLETTNEGDGIEIPKDEPKIDIPDITV